MQTRYVKLYEYKNSNLYINNLNFHKSQKVTRHSSVTEEALMKFYMKIHFKSLFKQNMCNNPKDVEF